jgi:NAD(P)-dependent dehydrogenase (short-subunit alcohol dehydrogenase family)
MSFAGKRTLVTGSGSGIDATVARQLAAGGAEVIVADLEPAAVAGELGAHALRLDVRDEVRVASAMESLDALRARQPMGRLGTPDEIADAILYLAAAEFVTGSVLVIDGGLTAA